jgi:hypothetical protein
MKRALLLSAMLLAACSTEEGPVGEATATITQVPTGVACIQIQVVGTRTVTKNVDVMPAQSSVVPLPGLPVGADTFSATAFAAPCPMIGGAIANWASDPVVAVVSAGAVVSVTLPMHGVGNANVGVDFPGDGGSPIDLSGPVMTPPDLSGAPVDLTAGPMDLSFAPDLSCVPSLPTCPSGVCGTTLSNGCGGFISCPPCMCVPHPSCGTSVCGTVSDGCGGSVSCGTCADPSTVCKSGQCVAACNCANLHCKFPLVCDPSACACSM